MRFTLNQRGIKSLEDSSEVTDELKAKVDKMVTQAKAIAPVDTGRYRDSIRAEVSGNEVRLISDDEVIKVLTIEFGKANTQAFATLRRAAEAVVGTQNMGRR